VSLITYFGSCGPIYDSLILCLETLGHTPLAILLLVLVYPHDQRGFACLHRHVAHSRYIQDFSAGVAAYRFQFLEDVFRESNRLLLAHLPNTLRHHSLCMPS
jgi:hypothetical protein